MLKKNFKIDSNLYSEADILKMIEDFSDFSLSYTSGILEIEGENNEEIEQLFSECMNYVVALYNENI